jgi:RNA polymerase sigma factor (TIGR02999 family)
MEPNHPPPRADPTGSSPDEFLAAAYQELRRLACQKMAKELPGQTLQPTALVHEAYLRIVAGESPEFQNGAHFFAAVAEAMRRILVEKARHRSRIRHGGGRQRGALEDADQPSPPSAVGVDLVAIDNLIARLEQQDTRMAEIVKLRYFAGLTSEETAAAMDLAPRTVYRVWTAARAWLRAELERPGDGC